jgi:hypothetical protein
MIGYAGCTPHCVNGLCVDCADTVMLCVLIGRLAFTQIHIVVCHTHPYAHIHVVCRAVYSHTHSLCVLIRWWLLCWPYVEKFHVVCVNRAARSHSHAITLWVCLIRVVCPHILVHTSMMCVLTGQWSLTHSCCVRIIILYAWLRVVWSHICSWLCVYNDRVRALTHIDHVLTMCWLCVDYVLAHAIMLCVWTVCPHTSLYTHPCCAYW